MAKSTTSVVQSVRGSWLIAIDLAVSLTDLAGREHPQRVCTEHSTEHTLAQLQRCLRYSH
eukprot:2098675-Rhodomonas_salina.2